MPNVPRPNGTLPSVHFFYKIQRQTVLLGRESFRLLTNEGRSILVAPAYQYLSFLP